MKHRSIYLAAACAAMLAGCAPPAPPAPTPESPLAEIAGPPASSVAAALESSTPEAYVTEVAPLAAEDVYAKIYSTAGGDPAINGLYTYLAVYVSPIDGWRVFQIGDFNEWKIASQDGRAVSIDVSRSFIDEAGEIATVRERVSFSVPDPDATALDLATAPLAPAAAE